MTTTVILLRGVMPSGRNKISMPRLRDVLGSAGFSSTRTYIQSGNVLVDSHLPPAEIEKTIHDLIRDHLGADLTAIALTGEELRAILDGNPFTAGYDRSRVFFIVFARPPQKERMEELLSRDYSPEHLVFGDQAAYLYIPGPYGKGTLSAGFLEKGLGVMATMRNFNTITRLVAMSRE